MPDATIYRAANALIARHGSNAAGHADSMMQRFLEHGDPQQAGRWLAIGQAIEDLSYLLAGHRKQ